MQNKANFAYAQMNVKPFLIMDYDYFLALRLRKNKPKQTQFKPKTNPIQSQFRANSKADKANSKPIKANFKAAGSRSAERLENIGNFQMLSLRAWTNRGFQETRITGYRLKNVA